MKILSKKKVEELFDDIMMLNLIASESTRQQMMGLKPKVKDLIRQQRIIIERCANAVYILKGMSGITVAYEMHSHHSRHDLRRKTGRTMPPVWTITTKTSRNYGETEDCSRL